MNRRNGVPISGAIQDCLCCAPCTMHVPIQRETQSRGRVFPDSAMGCFHRACPYLVATPLLVRNSPASPRRSSGKGQDGSDPPLFAAVSARGEGGCTSRCTTAYPPPLFRGRSRPIDPCGKVPDTDPKRALTRRRQAP